MNHVPDTLTVDIERRYRSGTVIQVALTHPLSGFSVTALVGASGCGKTTVLRSLAGLEIPQAGRICCGGEVWFDATTGACLPPQKRGIGYLFQEYALFPHLTVRENLAFGLRRLPVAEQRERIGELLRLLHLEGLDERYPRELSGGQQQRAALARTVAPRPRLLLLDEPLSALDAPTRRALRSSLKEILRTLGIPTFLVTHDADEVAALADQVVVLHCGRVLQAGPREEVLRHPASSEVASIVTGSNGSS